MNKLLSLAETIVWQDLHCFSPLTTEIPNFDELKKYDKVVLLGTGGSSLGAQVINSFAKNDKLIFLETIEPELLESLDLPNNSAILVISKSGNTTETMVQVDYLSRKYSNFYLLTDPKPSLLRTWAETNGYPIFEHPLHIGGRYSIFSIVGTLPGIIAGADVGALHQGAKQHLANLSSLELAQSVFEQLDYSQHVVMPYNTKLEPLTRWYRQLSAESLGKNGLGLTPIAGIGPIDHHSQLQLYLDGPKDKFFTIIKPFFNQDCDLTVFFPKQGAGQILRAQCDAAIEVLKSHKIKVRVLECKDIADVGAIIAQWIMEIILLAKAWGVNPFDQPAVEAVKVATKQILAGQPSAA